MGNTENHRRAGPDLTKPSGEARREMGRERPSQDHQWLRRFGPGLFVTLNEDGHHTQLISRLLSFSPL